MNISIGPVTLAFFAGGLVSAGAFFVGYLSSAGLASGVATGASVDSDIMLKMSPPMLLLRFCNSTLVQWPGIDFIIEPKYQQEAAKLGPGQVCQFGKLQTPIDLSTNLKVLKNFEDKDFKFEYDEVAQNSGQLKFNQTGADIMMRKRL